jgi:hypothetical protein
MVFPPLCRLEFARVARSCGLGISLHKQLATNLAVGQHGARGLLVPKSHAPHKFTMSPAMHRKRRETLLSMRHIAAAFLIGRFAELLANWSV